MATASCLPVRENTLNDDLVQRSFDFDGPRSAPAHRLKVDSTASTLNVSLESVVTCERERREQVKRWRDTKKTTNPFLHGALYTIGLLATAAGIGVISDNVNNEDPAQRTLQIGETVEEGRDIGIGITGGGAAVLLLALGSSIQAADTRTFVGIVEREVPNSRRSTECERAPAGSVPLGLVFATAKARIFVHVPIGATDAQGRISIEWSKITAQLPGDVKLDAQVVVGTSQSVNGMLATNTALTSLATVTPPGATDPELAWQAAITTDTVEGYRAYQQRFPQSAHLGDADVRIKAVLAREALRELDAAIAAENVERATKAMAALSANAEATVIATAQERLDKLEAMLRIKDVRERLPKLLADLEASRDPGPEVVRIKAAIDALRVTEPDVATAADTQLTAARERITARLVREGTDAANAREFETALKLFAMASSVAVAPAKIEKAQATAIGNAIKTGQAAARELARKQKYADAIAVIDALLLGAPQQASLQADRTRWVAAMERAKQDEAARQARLAAAEQAKLEREEQQRKLREEREAKDKERLDKLAADKAAREAKDKERLDKLAADKAAREEAERVAREERATRVEQERAMKAKAEADRREREAALKRDAEQKRRDREAERLRKLDEDRAKVADAQRAREEAKRTAELRKLDEERAKIEARRQAELRRLDDERAKLEGKPIKLDAIVLKNGIKVEGRVKEQVRGQYVIIAASDGTKRTIKWDTIAEVIVWSAPEAAPAAHLKTDVPTTVATAEIPTGQPLKLGKKTKRAKKVLKVSTTTAFNATKEGATLSRTVTCKTDNDPTCKETAQLTMGREGPKASYTSESDCSKKPGSGNCTESKSLGVSGAGFGASFTKEEVVAVDEKARPSKATNFSVTGLVGFGVGGDAQIVITNADLNLKLLSGKKFPDKRGGNWMGFALEPTLGFVVMSVTADMVSFTMAGVRAGSSLGFQFMKFGKLDEKSMKQKGIGVFLGLFLGVQAVKGQVEAFGMTISQSQTNAQIGPQINLVFPSYNAGTAKYKSSSLNFMILPTGKDVFISIGATTSF